MRADRLLSIMLLLQNGGKVTTRALAAKLEVSERTITRDMDALSAAGIPIYAERGPLGGWRLTESYRTTLTGLGKEELLALLVNSQSKLLHDLGILKTHQEAAYQKIVASSPASLKQYIDTLQERIHIDGAPWHTQEEHFPYLSLLQEAIWTQHKLEMRYRKTDGSVNERIVQPIGLVAKGNVWYLVAMDGQEKAAGDDTMRSFRISRMLDAQRLEEGFERPENFSLAQYWERSTAEFKASLPAFPACICITKQRLTRLSRNRYVKVIRTSSLQEHKEGWVTAEIQFDTLESARELLLGCGREARVISPQELAEAMQAEAKAIVELYNK
ncbi:helix-turn-helix transcriptional regulator [Paenibacillus brevis]|uniref:YafY family transcriptional regulator n=1 Tax=Paenibacillus brevis TaxID=2841508 RepID=A0ABS6FNE4_9BACL|nr:YafY family protein [Paenibacillus brevis]MBU5671669.1 YafY family transcriptional regulator [Paenibacillus brevis]